VPTSNAVDGKLMVFITQIGNAWVLGTDNSLYAIAIGEDSLPVQRYWGDGPAGERLASNVR